MVLLGAGSGALDVGMNAQGVTVERRYPRRIFASLHAAFSAGALVGALTAGLVAEAGVPLAVHLLVAAASVGLALALALRAFLPDAPEARSGPAFARPSRPLAALGAVALCALLAEGAMSDWSAVYLSRVLGSGPGTAAAGLAVFSVAMAAGRLAGDPLAERLGARRLTRAGLALAAAAFGAAALAPGPPVALGTFALLGLGLAAAYPLALRAAAEQPRVPSGPAIAAVTTTGYLGFLAGPPLVGLLAEATSLRASLAAVGALCVVGSLLARALAPDAEARASTASMRAA
jgi:predicted MFS family arabinose efflux permease